MPTTRANKQDSRLIDQLVMLAGCGIGVGDGAPDGIAEIDLTVEQVVPKRSARVLKISHEYLCAGVKRVDDHLAVNGTGDLYAAVQDVVGQRCHRPRALANVPGFFKKIGFFPGIESFLPFMTR
jgi:hypothetical protein